ncbi:putative dehydrogenase [Hoeflea phototrophica DFL-43]|uniref:Putative dehydrogenase n=1 Tax=Hoeflea phototrophica (strain DSM 17068 / NCIMB 14078 / DFL-43) TaxID=411684 RepID=A9CZT0_HOEPD|nr:Gfo/Idh/MocA family oxidoreductase [Hoeflea phototrophica]EDQ34837.2 putative dehydrogenase [Hoeflea phototrophica DFL-43]
MRTTKWKSAALIGAGRMGRAHATALRELGVELTAICDSNLNALGELGDAFGVPNEMRFDSASRLFERLGSVDIVSIATTAESHKNFTCLAAEAKCGAILCEKPMATSVKDCESMIAACAASGTKLAINHQMRFMDQYLVVKEAIKNGGLGKMASMTVVGGCFGFAMNGSHYIEAFRYLTGSEPEYATAWFSDATVPNPRGPHFFDQAGEIRIVGTDGQRLNLIIGPDQGHGMTVTYAGAYGHIFVDELQGEAIITTRKPEHRAMPATRYGMPWDRETIHFPQSDNVQPTKAVLAALAAGRNYPTGEDARLVVAALAACYKSAETGNVAVGLQTLDDFGSRTFPWA